MSHPTYVISISPQAKWYVLIWFKYSIPLTCLKIKRSWCRDPYLAYAVFNHLKWNYSKFESKSKSTKYSAWKNLADKLTKSVEQVYVILEHPDEEISKYQRKFELFQVSDIDHVMDLWINMSADNALEIIAIEARVTNQQVEAT